MFLWSKYLTFGQTQVFQISPKIQKNLPSVLWLWFCSKSKTHLAKGLCDKTYLTKIPARGKKNPVLSRREEGEYLRKSTGKEQTSSMIFVNGKRLSAFFPPRNNLEKLFFAVLLHFRMVWMMRNNGAKIQMARKFPLIAIRRAILQNMRSYVKLENFDPSFQHFTLYFTSAFWASKFETRNWSRHPQKPFFKNVITSYLPKPQLGLLFGIIIKAQRQESNPKGNAFGAELPQKSFFPAWSIVRPQYPIFWFNKNA